MRFVTQERVIDFHGHIFFRGVPVTVRDKATVARCLSDPRFHPVEEAKDETQEAQAAPQVLDPHACDKCGRIVRQGMFLHRRHCKGRA